MKRTLLRIMTLALMGCGGSKLGSRLEYEVYEVPHPLLGGEAGSCLSRHSMYYSEIKAFKWAIGCQLEVYASWPDRGDCSSSILGSPRCPNVPADVITLNSAAWNAQLTGSAAVAVVAVRAVGTGDGGFAVRANGDAFNPDFVLTASSFSDIWFERANGPGYTDVIPGRISELRLALGQDAAVAVTLRNAAGEHLCGPVPATLSTSGNVFSVERLGDGDFVNLPYRVIAGTAAGEGSLQFTAGVVSATLHIIVGGP